jgi:methyl-accepting chemotaxis protein
MVLSFEEEYFVVKMTIKYRLVAAFMVVLIIPCATIGWFSYQKAESQLSSEIMGNAIQTANFVNNQISDLVSPGMTDMDYMAAHIHADMLDGNANSKIRNVLDPYKAVHNQYETAFYGTNNRVMIFSPDKKIDGYDPTTRPWFIKAMENKGKAIISDPFVSATTGNISISSAKTTDDGLGVVGVNLDLGKFSQEMNSFKVGKSGYVYILDTNHKYISHPSNKSGDLKKDDYTDKFYAADSGTLDYQLNGISKKAVFVTNPITGWKVIGTIETSEIAKSAQGILYTTLIVVALAMLVSILIITWIVRSITSPLKQIMTSMEGIANGNLVDEIPNRSNDELGQLASSVNHMIQNLRSLIGGVISTSQNLAAAAEQISATTEEVAHGSSLQAQASQKMQDMFSELSMAINAAASSADDTSQLAAKTSSIAQDGGLIVDKSVVSMNEVSTQVALLEEDSNKIGEIIEVIGDIADQTNLLALNAAIEAARAGEQGRGFAVVADEVRKLAERSGEATKQITAIIKGMQDNTHKSVLAVNNGVSQSKETGEAFANIIQMINQTENKVGDIAAACEEQAAQSDEVMHSIESISAISEESAAAAQETAATSQSLARLAEGLNDSVSIFKIH